MSNEVQAALDRLLDPTAARRKSRPTSHAAEAEAAELYELAERVGRLHEVRAPRRLREHGLDFVFAQPVPVRRRHLWLVPPPERRGQLAKALSQVAASVLVVLTVGFYTASASSSSLPDSPLYNVRLLTEEVQVAFSPAEHRPQIYVAQAQRHTDESVALLEQGGRPEVAKRLSDDAVRRIDSAKNAAERTSDPETARTQVAEVEPVVREVQVRAEEQVQQRVANRAADVATPTAPRVLVQVLPTEPPTAIPPTSVPEPTNVTVAPTSVPTVNVAAPGSTTGFATIGASGSPAPTSESPRPTEPPAAVSAPQTPFVRIPAGESTPVPTATSVGVSAPVPTFLPIGATSTATPRPTQPPSSPTVTRTPTATNVPPTATPGAPVTASPTRTSTGQLEAPAIGFTPIVIGTEAPGA